METTTTNREANMTFYGTSKASWDKLRAANPEFASAQPTHEDVLYMDYLRGLSYSELQNEAHTLHVERRYLDLTDDQVADRIGYCDDEFARRGQAFLGAE